MAREKTTPAQNVAMQFDQLAKLTRNLLIDNVNFGNRHYVDTTPYTFQFIPGPLNSFGRTLLERIAIVRQFAIDMADVTPINEATDAALLAELQKRGYVITGMTWSNQAKQA